MKTIEELGISPAPWKQGEWVPFREDNVVRCEYIRKNGTKSTRIVASCNAAFSFEQARIDARLIAAAPELYKAMFEQVTFYCEHCLDTNNVTECPDKSGVCKVMEWRKLLEKAGGK